MGKCILLLPWVVLLTSCQPNHSINLAPTIEERARPAAVIEMRDPRTALQLLRGFNQLEEQSWRWTTRSFAVRLGTPPGANRGGAWLLLNFNLPEVALQRLNHVTISAQVDHTRLENETYDRPGPHEYRGDLSPRLLQNDSVLAEFSLDRYLPAGAMESRELGLVVSSIALEPK